MTKRCNFPLNIFREIDAFWTLTLVSRPDPHIDTHCETKNQTHRAYRQTSQKQKVKFSRIAMCERRVPKYSADSLISQLYNQCCGAQHFVYLLFATSRKACQITQTIGSTNPADYKYTILSEMTERAEIETKGHPVVCNFCS